jgi:hypothetical protein
MLRRAAIVALVTAGLRGGGLEAQEPWPGAACYALTRGGWTRTDRSSRPEREPDMPDLIVLDSARRGALLGLGDRPDTAGRVVHAMTRDRRSPTATYASQWWDRWFSGWKRPTPDSVTVTLGTGHGGLEFRFRVDGDRLVGVAESWVDYGVYWTARLVGRRTRCPEAPPSLGRLRLTVAEAPGLATPYDLPMPEVDIELSTEAPARCGASIHYDMVVRDTLLAVTLHGLSRAGACVGAAGHATTRLGGLLRPGRYTVLVGTPTGTDSNHFALMVSDSSMQLTTLRSTFVTADERMHRRPAHNLFVLRCGQRPAGVFCDEVERWLLSLPGIGRAGALPHKKRISEDVWVALFRYDSRATLERIRACMGSIAERIRPTAGVSMTIRTWLGEEIEASSARETGPHDPVPAGVTAAGACAA